MLYNYWSISFGNGMSYFSPHDLCIQHNIVLIVLDFKRRKRKNGDGDIIMYIYIILLFDKRIQTYNINSAAGQLNFYR